MMAHTLETPVPLHDALADPPRRISAYHLLLGGALAVVWGVLCRALSGEWSVNPQYSYGWFVPFFTAYLLWVRWGHRPEPNPPTPRLVRLAAIAITVPALLLLLPVRLFEVSSPDWRVLGWVHAAIVLTLSFFLLWRAGGTQWLRHFAFPICFFLVAVPWILAIETPIVQGLMRGVAAAASDTLALFGIPAQVEGAVIHINNGTVGVNEACSGVRSLQTALMIALLLGELKQLTTARRTALVLCGTALALAANFGRSLFLVWIAATRDITAVERWHDTAGYSIVVIVLVGCLGLTSLLARGIDHGDESPAHARRRARAPSISWLVTVLCSALLIEAVVEAWYRWNDARTIPQPRWTVKWPNTEPGYRTIAIDERARGLLRFDSGGAARWHSSDASTERALDELYFFRWNAGSTSVLRARAHRPDICLPAAGWRQIANCGTQTHRLPGGVVLTVRHFKFASDSPHNAPLFADAFYCVSEDRAAPDGLVLRDSEAELAGPFHTAVGYAMLVRAGIRNRGQQVLEFIELARRDRPAAEAESRFAALLPQLVQLNR